MLGLTIRKKPDMSTAILVEVKGSVCTACSSWSKRVSLRLLASDVGDIVTALRKPHTA